MTSDGRIDGRRGLSLVLAAAYLVWSGFLALGAGFIGALLNCSENTDGCHSAGFPSLLEPWTWDDFDVFPEVFFIALAGLLAAVALLVSVLKGRRPLAAIAFASSLVLLSYPFFAGLTDEGRTLLASGALLGFGAVAFTPRPSATPPDPS